jgi:hypothetical protein
MTTDRSELLTFWRTLAASVAFDPVGEIDQFNAEIQIEICSLEHHYPELALALGQLKLETNRKFHEVRRA